MNQSNYEDELIARNQELRRLIEEAKLTHIPIAAQLKKLQDDQKEREAKQQKWFDDLPKESKDVGSFSKFTFPMIRKMFSDKS